MPFFFVFKRVVFCCFATVLQQTTFLTAIFLRKTCRLQLCQGRFVVVGEQTCNLTVPVWSFAGFALFFATLLPFGQVGQLHVLCKTFAGTASFY